MNKFKYKVEKNIILPGTKSVFLIVPKVASSSIKSVIKEEYNFVADNAHDIEYDYFNRNELINSKDYFKFGFIRNPLDRLLSCYISKIINKTTMFKSFHKYKNFKENMSFKEFVYAVADIPDKKADAHFCSQYTFLKYNGKFIADFIGMLENINNDWNYIKSKTGIKTNLPCLQKTSSSIKYTPELIKITKQRYKEDFKLYDIVKRSKEL